MSEAGVVVGVVLMLAVALAFALAALVERWTR